ncbi:hypothetical protein E2C01_046959 [Portunus trituberculatus]|uniref:Uncharacterized protein n=1 Tax=Portunus trituberculatus TaxID=210409 RepID=A0A5B7G6M3_PORTR|nr:hypothetical protein [Portunus trituberculatus]
MTGRQDTQREGGSKASPGNYLLHPTQLQVDMAAQEEVKMEAARKRAPKKAGRGAGEHCAEHRKDLNYGWPAGLMVPGVHACRAAKRYAGRTGPHKEEKCRGDIHY